VSQLRPLTPAQFVALAANPFAVDDMAVRPTAASPICVVDLRAAAINSTVGDADHAGVLESVGAWPVVVVGLIDSAAQPPSPLVDACDTLLGSHPSLPAAEGPSPDQLAAAISASPVASVALAQLLRFSPGLPVREALRAESLTYSVLQSGPTHANWLASRSTIAPSPAPSSSSTADQPAVIIQRCPGTSNGDGDALQVQLNRPEVHNAFSAEMRDGLGEALRVAAADPSIGRVRISGRGPSFCAGGDLREFGQAPDPATGHLARMARHPGQFMHLAGATTAVSAHLHGVAVGAGIELSAFATEVTATSDTEIWLPEVAMGLIPGAGGTVSIPRRIGRHRTMFMALTGQRIRRDTAVSWGLVDRLVQPG